MKTRLKASQKIKALLESRTRLFDTRSLSALWGIGPDSAKVAAFRMACAGILIPVRRGLYGVVSKEPSVFEIAHALYQPSVISLESALNHWGVLVQSPQVITSIANRSRRFVVQKTRFVYRRVPKKILDIGAIQVQGTYMTTPQKALLDYLYFGVKGLCSVQPGDLFLGKQVHWGQAQEYLRFYPATCQERMDALLKKILKGRYRGVR